MVPVFLQVFSRVLEHLLLVLSLLRLLLVLLSDFRVLSLPFWRSIASSFCLCCLYWRSCFLVSYGIASRAGVFINVQAGVSTIVVVFFFMGVPRTGVPFNLGSSSSIRLLAMMSAHLQAYRLVIPI